MKLQYTKDVMMVGTELPRRRVVVIFNPTAGRARRKRLAAVVCALEDLGCDVKVIDTQAPGHAEQIVSGFDTSAVDVMVAAGGDGTINEVVNGLRGKPIALAIIPLGTANVLADEVGLSRKSQRVAKAIAYGPMREIHVGNANGRRFVMMAGAGFDAEVVDGVRLDLKKIVGPLAYVWEMVRQAFIYGWSSCDVEIDGASYRAASAIVCKGRSYGGPFTAAPRADLEDDRFQVVMFKRKGWLNVLRYGVALVTARLPYLSDVEIIPGRKVSIRGHKGAPVQADGDILARLPVNIEIDDEPVKLAFPI